MTKMVQPNEIVVWMIIEHPSPDISSLPSQIEVYRSYVKDDIFHIALNGESIFSGETYLKLLVAKNEIAVLHKTRISADIALMKKVSLASQTQEISLELTRKLVAICDQIELSIYETDDE